MPLKCPCGEENPEGAAYCNKCGRELRFRPEGPATCPSCMHLNPQHIAYCGNCGADLDREYAKSVTSEEYLPSLVPSDAYIVGHSPPGASGVLHATRSQFITNLIITIPFAILLFFCFVVYESLLGATVWLASALVLYYASWRLGRERAGWGG